MGKRKSPRRPKRAGRSSIFSRHALSVAYAPGSPKGGAKSLTVTFLPLPLGEVALSVCEMTERARLPS